jgi:hypothetical protein
MLLKIKAEIIGFTLEYRQAEREVVGNSIRNINLVLVEPSLKLGQSYKGVKSGFSMLYEQPSRREPYACWWRLAEASAQACVRRTDELTTHRPSTRLPNVKKSRL